MCLYLNLLLGVLRRALRSRDDLLMENLVLRQQLAVYARRPKRPRLRDEDRLFWSAVARAWAPWRSHVHIVQPETVIRWHRTAWRRYWSWKSRARRPGRPRIDSELRDLIRRMARENHAGERCASSGSCVRWGSRSALRPCGVIAPRRCGARLRNPGARSSRTMRRTSGLSGASIHARADRHRRCLRDIERLVDDEVRSGRARSVPRGKHEVRSPGSVWRVFPQECVGSRRSRRSACVRVAGFSVGIPDLQQARPVASAGASAEMSAHTHPQPRRGPAG